MAVGEAGGLATITNPFLFGRGVKSAAHKKKMPVLKENCTIYRKTQCAQQMLISRSNMKEWNTNVPKLPGEQNKENQVGDSRHSRVYVTLEPRSRRAL